MAKPPGSVIVHSLGHARAAAAAAAATGCAVRLLSAPGAAGYAGPAWFAEMIAQTRRAHPSAAVEAVLDCGASPGDVLAALRRGIEAIRYDGPAPTRRKLAAIAAACGARLDRARGPSLDLDGVADPAEAVAGFLAGLAGRSDRRKLTDY